MHKWLLLSGAILGEVCGTMLLRAARDHVGWIPLVVIAYVISFALLGLTLRTGMAVSVAYGIWGAVGVALTALLGAVIFGELLSLTAVVGILVIISGVVLIEMGAHSAADLRDGSETSA